jgi:hypothetical protein
VGGDGAAVEVIHIGRRPGKGSVRWNAIVGFEEVAPVLLGYALMGRLRIYRPHAALVVCGLLLRAWTYVDTATTAVVAHAVIDIHVVDDGSVDVDIANHRGIYA